MMSPAKFLEKILLNIPAPSVTNAFILILLVVFALAIRFAKQGTHRQFVQYAPNLLTSLGILGTFVGIVIGLLGFDANNIDDSIGPLLEGLKTAFITSLVGMLLAIVFKMLDSGGLIAGPKQEDEPEAVTPEHIFAVLTRQEEALNRLNKTIAGEEEGALISQVRFLRSDLSDQQKALRDEVRSQKEAFAGFQARLWQELAHFAEMLSKSATEQIINALKEVIADFNKNLTEQFGDNFKHLNEGVEKLVDWQENYRQQLEQMGDQYAEGVKAIDHTKELVSQIATDAQSIPQTMESLKGVIETAQHQLAELERHLNAFAEMRDQAIDAIPEIQAQVDAIVKDIAAAAKESGAQIYEVIQRIEVTLDTGIQEFQNNVAGSNESLAAATDALASKSGEISEQLRASLGEIQEQTGSMVDKINVGSTTIAQTLADTNTELKSQVAQVHELIAESMRQASGRVEEALGELTETMRSSLEEIQEQTGSMVEKINAGSTSMAQTLADTNRGLKDQVEQVHEMVAESIRQASAMVEKTLDELTKHHLDAASKASHLLSQEMEKSVGRTGDAVNAQLKALDKALEQEMERVIGYMGKSLAQISSKFTSDYKKLTEQMQAIVNQADHRS